MKLLCKLFGHRMWYAEGDGGDYGRVTGGYTDGIKREHYQLRVKCSRCGEEFHAGSFHGPLNTNRRPLYTHPIPSEPGNARQEAALWQERYWQLVQQIAKLEMLKAPPPVVVELKDAADLLTNVKERK